jgi:hypothetical protein
MRETPSVRLLIYFLVCWIPTLLYALLPLISILIFYPTFCCFQNLPPSKARRARLSGRTARPNHIRSNFIIPPSITSDNRSAAETEIYDIINIRLPAQFCHNPRMCVYRPLCIYVVHRAYLTTLSSLDYTAPNDGMVSL